MALINFIDQEVNSLKRGAGRVRATTSKRKPAIDLSDDDILGSKANVDKKGKPKERSSVWSITINLNKPYEDMSSEDKTKFKQFANYLFQKKNMLKYITDQTSPTDSSKNIDNMQLDYNFEVGKKLGLLHLHGLCRIQHHGFLRMRLNDIREVAKRQFGHAIHLDAPVSGDPISAWQAYMRKGVAPVDMA